MNYKEKFFNLFTMCEKSGKLAKGFDMSKEAVIKKKASCIMITSDVSPKTIKEVMFISRDYSDDFIVKIPFGMDEINKSIGKKVGVMAVCDKGFATKLSEYATAAYNMTD